MGQYLRLVHDQNPTFRSDSQHQTLAHIADAVRSAITNDEPWPNASWQHLRNRADRWHRENFQRDQELSKDRTQQLANQNWDSALDTVDIEHFTFVPITDALTLVQLGDQMRNCLSSFTTRCMNNQTRVFRVDQHGQPIGAVSIAQIEGRWLSDQAEGNNRNPLPQRISKLHKDLTERYNQAETA